MDPISGDYVSMPSSSAFLVQNRERCFTLETILAKDASENTKKILFFQFMADLATDNSADESSNPSNKVYQGLCPCNFSSTGCMVCRNKNAKKGVISGTKKYFCMHCDETRDSLCVPKANLRANICKALH